MNLSFFRARIAIQFFTKSKGLRYGSEISGASAMKKAEMVESSEKSNINHVLSLLVPQPRESESMLAPDEHVGSKPSQNLLLRTYLSHKLTMEGLISWRFFSNILNLNNLKEENHYMTCK
ncbi:hypothetical protein AgCh_016239 [Apium graveolens]